MLDQYELPTKLEIQKSFIENNVQSIGQHSSDVLSEEEIETLDAAIAANGGFLKIIGRSIIHKVEKYKQSYYFKILW